MAERTKVWRQRKRKRERVFEEEEEDEREWEDLPESTVEVD